MIALPMMVFMSTGELTKRKRFLIKGMYKDSMKNDQKYHKDISRRQPGEMKRFFNRKRKPAADKYRWSCDAIQKQRFILSKPPKIAKSSEQ